MSNLTAFGNANLPDADIHSLAASLRAASAEISNVSGFVIIKMDKTGHWVFGADQTEVEDDSTWAINPHSFIKGYIAWGDGEVLGEKMVDVRAPDFDPGDAPVGAKKGWEKQVGFSLKCMSGEDKNLEARYRVTSEGGKKAWAHISDTIAEQIKKDALKPVPVVKLKKGSYPHKSYGRIITPVFEVIEWVGLDGAPAETEAAEAVTDDTPSESRRRRRSA